MTLSSCAARTRTPDKKASLKSLDDRLTLWAFPVIKSERTSLLNFGEKPIIVMYARVISASSIVTSFPWINIFSSYALLDKAYAARQEKYFKESYNFVLWRKFLESLKEFDMLPP